MQVYDPDEVRGSLLEPVLALAKSGKMWLDEKVVGLVRELFLPEDESAYDWKHAPVFDLVHDKVIVP